MSAGTSQAAAAPVGAWPDPVRSRLTDYYTRYYRDALGIPGWRDLVAARLERLLARAPTGGYTTVREAAA